MSALIHSEESEVLEINALGLEQALVGHRLKK
jgi:hypothetical protein